MRMAKKKTCQKMPKKKMYHVHECFQNRDWIILAKNAEEAQKEIIENCTDADDYPYDGEWEFKFTECTSGFELKAKIQVDQC
jgi:hypothetical protein